MFVPIPVLVVPLLIPLLGVAQGLVLLVSPAGTAGPARGVLPAPLSPCGILEFDPSWILWLLTLCAAGLAVTVTAWHCPRGQTLATGPRACRGWPLGSPPHSEGSPVSIWGLLVLQEVPGDPNASGLLPKWLWGGVGCPLPLSLSHGVPWVP